MLQKLSKRVVTKIFKPLIEWYISNDRMYHYKGLRLVVKKGVFHPGLFFSTKLFALWLCKQPLGGKKILEIGTGSGMLSLVLARKGALVTATDINPVAVETAGINAQNNNFPVTIIQSDLFDQVPDDISFDYIIVNPPYYPKDPTSDADKAWFCGSEFQYFHKFFSQLSMRRSTEICYMILSEDCNIEKIRSLALVNGLSFSEIFSESVWWELNYIFEIKRINQ